MERFPAGGRKQPVYDFLKAHGFIMSKWSDKHWERADGLHLHLYGTGSMARIIKDNAVVAEGPLEETVDAIMYQS